jgi:hypothetical protein
MAGSLPFSRPDCKKIYLFGDRRLACTGQTPCAGRRRFFTLRHVADGGILFPPAVSIFPLGANVIGYLSEGGEGKAAHPYGKRHPVCVHVRIPLAAVYAGIATIR